MKTPPQLDFDQSYAWFFDIDGTLLEFAETPEQAHVSENLRELLSRVQQHADQALALITGRSIASADSLFAPLKLPTAGQHGFERRGPQGKLHYLGANSLPEDELQAILAIENRHPGTLIENKGGCVAVHYRRVPELGESVIQLVEDIAASLKPDYETLKGNNVIEIKRANCNKGHAVRAYMEREPFLGRTPLFFGDDTTDIPAMEATMELGGIAVSVGPKPLPGHHGFKEVTDLLNWLTSCMER